MEILKRIISSIMLDMVLTSEYAVYRQFIFIR